MRISSRFTIAIHMLSCMDYFSGEQKVTSDFMASSINVNPVVVRQLLSRLKAAGLVEVKRGSGGAAIAKPAGEISLLDIYRAVDCVESEGLFHFHENPNPNCPVGRSIHRSLDGRLDQIQSAMEREMAAISLAEVLADMRESLQSEKIF